MRWTCRHEKFSRLNTWTGRKNNIKFEINETYEGDYYILADYTKEDIRWNSLWNKIRFDNLDEAKQHLNKIEQQNRKKTAKEFRNYRPTIAELAKAFKAEEKAENKKYNL